MHILNNTTSETKVLILRVFNKFPGKLLLIIDVILSIQHCDIRHTLLMIIFGRLQFDHTYDICTYVNIDGYVKSMLCYSKICGFEYNPYCMSNHLINYFDNTYNIHDDKVRSNQSIDPEFTGGLYLISTSEYNKLRIVGCVKELEVSLFVYFVDISLYTINDSKEHIISQFKEHSTNKDSVIYKFIVGKININASGLNINDIIIRTNHNIINGKLC